MHIRFAKLQDAPQILDIYKPFVENTAVSFETIVPKVEDIANRVISLSQTYPWLVAETDGRMAGYCYAAKHREREAYQYAVEVSVYIHPDYYRKGIAKLLYDRLFSLLKEMGVTNVYAVIALPNPASISFHSSLGFEPFCVYKNIGFKNGDWHDVMWLVKYINEHRDNPLPLKGIKHLKHLL